MRCPLCETKQNSLYYKNRKREFYRCETCQLTFVPDTFHLSPFEEKKRYLHHQNSSENSGYKKFLKILTEPLTKLLVPKVDFLGLDFGCGPSETLANLMKEEGYNFKSFDPYFKSKEELLDLKYDVITCSEAIEHFSKPGVEWKRLIKLLKPGGILAIMTQLNSFEKKFSEWWYIRDLTHISFFSSETFKWLGKRDNLSSSFHGNSVIIFKKKGVLK